METSIFSQTFLITNDGANDRSSCKSIWLVKAKNSRHCAQDKMCPLRWNRKTVIKIYKPKEKSIKSKKIKD